jgi:hypothetical protein
MPLITSNLVVGSQPQQAQRVNTPVAAPRPTPAPPPPPVPVAAAPVQVVSVNNEPIERHDSVVVGGKQKTIAKSSAYLMDMITIENL